MQNFDRYRPGTISEALDLRKRLGEGGIYLNGGTDLLVRLKENLEQLRYLIDLKGIAELKKFYLNKEGLFLGGTVTLKEIISSSEVGQNFPGLKEAASSIGSYQIQVRGTLVGNLVSSVPSADTAPILLCYEAEAITEGFDGERAIKLTSFFKGPRLNILKPEEIVKGVFIPKPSFLHTSTYLKLGRRAAVDLAVVGVAALVLDTPSGFEYRVALGAVAPTPVRALRLEEFLRHKILTKELLEKAIPLVVEDISPIDDVRSSRDYRLEISKVLTKRTLTSTWERLLLRREDGYETQDKLYS